MRQNLSRSNQPSHGWVNTMTSVKKPFKNSKHVALSVCLSGLYAISCFIPLFQILGSRNFITLAAMLAPTYGMLFGPFVGILSALVGGYIGFLMGVLSPMSLASGIVASFSAGLLRLKKRVLCISLYLFLLCVFTFYPPVGPFWLFPPFIWFQIIGLLILVWHASWKSNPTDFISFLAISLVSTLAGQIAGSVTFEVTYWPILIPDLNAWRGTWQALTFIYPIERTIIAIGSTIIGIAIHKALKGTSLTLDG